MRKPQNTGIISLWDLPKKETYIDLEYEFKWDMLNTARKLARDQWTVLSRKANISNEALRSFRRGKSTSLWLIKQLSNFLVSKRRSRFSLKNIEKNISLVRTASGQPIFNPKFPLDFNCKDGAIIISALYCDGGIYTRDVEPFYTNYTPSMILRFISAVENLIGKVHINKGPKFHKQVDFPKILGIMLTSIGLVPGRRPINNPKFPEFVFNSSKEFMYEFIAQAIGDDGYVYCVEDKIGFIAFNFTIDLTRFSKELRNKVRREKILDYLPNVLLGLKQLFEMLKINVLGPYFGNEKCYFKDGKESRYTQEWRIQIRDWRSLNILRNHINIPLKYKQNKLCELVRRGRKLISFDPRILEVINKLDTTSVRTITNSLVMPSRTVRGQLNNMCTNGLVAATKTVMRERYFSLTDKGLDELHLYEFYLNSLN